MPTQSKVKEERLVLLLKGMSVEEIWVWVWVGEEGERGLRGKNI